MDVGCLPPEELEAIGTLPADDPRRRHLEHCPRCRTLARRYRQFVDPAPLPAAAGGAAAGRELSRRLHLAIPELAPVGEANHRGRDTADPGRSHIWRRPARPLLAIAAVLVCCLGLLALRHQLSEPQTRGPADAPVLLRGDPNAPPLLTVTREPAGVRLAWQTPAGTDKAVVVLLDERFQETARLTAGAGGALVLAAGQIGAARYARVLFEDRGDVVAMTRTVALP